MAIICLDSARNNYRITSVKQVKPRDFAAKLVVEELIWIRDYL